MSTFMTDVIDDLIIDLNNDEGRRKSAYSDSRGYLTIGVGRCVDSRLDCGLSDDEMDFLLRNDIQEVIKECTPFYWYQILDTDNRRRAILNMAFNLGLHGLLKFTTFLRLLQEKKWHDAADDLHTTLWSREVGQRAVRIAQLIRNG
jgi:lysozyme